jgi:hypothetical protein
MKYSIKFIQSELKRQGFNPGPIDGILGNKTLTALSKVQGLPKTWTTERKLVGFIQISAEKENIEAGKIDGLWGPQTAHAYESLLELRKHGTVPIFRRPGEQEEVNPNNWPSQKNEADLIAFYGQVGTNQTSVIVPYPHVIAWDKSKSVTKIRCHKKVSDSMVRVLTKVKDHYGMEEIKRLRLDIWGGCLNVRQMRGGSRYSMHSWGIAMDYDPENNRLKWGSDKATFALPDYNKWWDFWEEEGWVSLGRTRNYDWMHIQAAKL